MAIFELFSKRKKRESGDVPDVYIYDQIPRALRVQIIHIWGDAIGSPETFHSAESLYERIVQTLHREYGLFRLDDRRGEPPYAELSSFFLTEKDTDKALDVIELSFRAIDRNTRSISYRGRRDCSEIADAAIQELNGRFKEHGVGYFYSDGIIARIDSELAHEEIVKPALAILRQKGFENAQAEFLAAHEHYRHGNKSESLVECYKAFESTMKIIATKRNWQIDSARGAADLVRVCLDNGLIPAYWQSHFAGLRSVLESAIPTPRNKQAAHGKGPQTAQSPPDELVAYVLHLTAATILFLAEAERKLP
jgi:uncharacterized protein DUF7014/AbiJ-like protein